MSAEMGICAKCGQRKRLTKDGLLYRHDNPNATMIGVDCLGSRRPVRQTFEKREFDNLIESQRPEIAEIETLWDGIKALWGPLHGGEGYLVKGVMLLEYMDTEGDRYFMSVASSNTSVWDIKGLIGQVQEEMATDAAADSMFKALMYVQQQGELESDDEDEDEQ